MDGLTLLAEARAAGLTLNVVSGRLVIRGPRRAELIARRLIEAKTAILAALECDEAPSETEAELICDLTRVLPPLGWLTPRQRRLWRERTTAYMADGWPRPAAETEAMAELVMTGKLFEPSTQCFTFD